MNQPRRLLLLAPFALLGAALLVRSRLPRPQTEGDKWLWEQGEKTPIMGINFNATGITARMRELHLSNYEQITLTSREGMRKVFRSFENTPAFQQDASHRPVGTLSPIIEFGGSEDDLAILEGKQSRNFLVYGKAYAPLNARSLTQFYSALHEAVNKARHHEPGYRIYNPQDGP